MKKNKRDTKNVFAKFVGKALVVVLSAITGISGIGLGSMVSAAPKNNPQLWNLNGQGVVLDGYDVVAYFTKSRAIKGNAKYQTKFKSGIFYFSTKENLATFKKSPDQYLPQYGGNCAYATWKDGLTKADPRVFKVRNGKLFLNYNRSVEVSFFRSYPKSRVGADKNWPGIVASEK